MASSYYFKRADLKGEYYMEIGYKPPFTMTDQITNLIIEIGELVGAISVAQGLSSNPKLRRINRIKTIYSSLAIEQNTLTIEQVSDVIEGRRVLASPQDIKEVKNAFEIYEKMGGLNPYSLEDLLKAHKVMMSDLIKEAGVFRSKGVGVYAGTTLIHAGTPPQYVPDLMKDLFDWLKFSEIHPLIKACIFHYEFEFIHPFSDGNGRTGRLWHTLILSKWKPFFAWIPIETLIYEHQEKYYKAINASNNKGESTDFIYFMLNLMKEALTDIKINKIVTDKMTDKMTDKEKERWKKIKEYLQEHEEIKNIDVQKILSISDSTVKRFLKKMVDYDLLESIGKNKDRKYKLK